MNRDERVKAIRDQADAGGTRAMGTLEARAYEAGDVVGARRWWELAAAAGETDVTVSLGILATRIVNKGEAIGKDW